MATAGVRLARALPIGNLAAAPAQGPGRHAQPPQDRGDRQPRHLLRQPELRRPRLRDQGEVRALGRCDDALRRPDRAAEPAPVRHRLDGPHQRGSERPRRRSPTDRSARAFPPRSIGTGAAVRPSAMPEMFDLADVRRPARTGRSPRPTTCPTSRSRPRSAPARGAGSTTTIVFPKRNDSWIVAAASRSYYARTARRRRADLRVQAGACCTPSR